jgi:1-acyl-sn-glycerol-3-phosphate acyltransferase
VIRTVLTAPFVALATIVGALLGIASAAFDRSGDTVLALARLWSRVVLTFSGVKLRVGGNTEIEAARPCVFVSNHTSTIDIWVLLAGLPPPVRMIAKKQLARVPFLGWAMSAGRFIFIDRQNPAAARRSIDEACGRIRGGSSVVIFPEGTRSRDGRLAPFKKGGFHLAIAAGVPIVPVGIRGAYALMPPGKLTVRSGLVTVEVGQPVATSGLNLAARDALIDRVRAEVGRLSGQELVPEEPADARDQ